ncbi:MAG: chloride channel protein [Oscillospiraceae bacterium]|nr:chloride channel protein [Oscillospiraceae bacterium]
MELWRNGRRVCAAAARYTAVFIKWLVISGLVGGISGLLGTLFHVSVEYATTFRIEHEWILWCLPLGGMLIVLLYRLCRVNSRVGTNQVILSIRTEEKIPILLAPLIFISTVITHLCGGSAGREGAALQLGGCVGSQVGHLFRLDEKDMHLVILCGMSGVFSALFGTPLTAVLFALEVISVGVLYYSGFIPCLVSSLTAYHVSLAFGVSPTRFSLETVPAISVSVLLQVLALSILCALLSIGFCVAIHQTEAWVFRVLKNELVRAALGGVLLIGLTYLVGTRDYNGTGMGLIAAAINGNARPEAFVLKLVFTVITIAAGLKGGEIVPTFFVGATFGCVAGGLLGLDPAFGAALGLIALFCGMVNCPLASIVLSIELFGAQGMLLFAIACGVSYVLSGYYGLYSSQKILYSKLRAEYININTK